MSTERVPSTDAERGLEEVPEAAVEHEDSVSPSEGSGDRASQFSELQAGANTMTASLPSPFTVELGGGHTLVIRGASTPEGEQQKGTATVGTDKETGKADSVSLANVAFDLKRGGKKIATGTINKGKVGADKSVTVDATASIAEGFSATLGGLKLTLDAGASLGVKVKDNSLEALSLAGIGFGADVELPVGEETKTAKLSGSLKSGSYTVGKEGIEIDVEGEATLGEGGLEWETPFFRIALGAGTASFSVVKNTPTSLSVDGLEFDGELKSNGFFTLPKGGKTRGKVDKGGDDDGGKSGWSFPGFSLGLSAFFDAFSLTLPSFPGFSLNFDPGSVPVSILPQGPMLDFSGLGIQFDLGERFAGLTGSISSALISLQNGLSGLFSFTGVDIEQKIIGEPPGSWIFGPGLVDLDFDLSSLAELALSLDGFEFGFPPGFWDFFQEEDSGEGDDTTRHIIESGWLRWPEGLGGLPKLSFSSLIGGLPAIPLPGVEGSVGPGDVILDVQDNLPTRVGIGNMPFSVSVAGFGLDGVVTEGAFEKTDAGWAPTFDVTVGLKEPKTLELGGEGKAIEGSLETGDIQVRVKAGKLEYIGIKDLPYALRLGETELSGTVLEGGYTFAGEGPDAEPTLSATLAATLDTPLSYGEEGAFSVGIASGASFQTSIENGSVTQLKAESVEMDISSPDLSFTGTLNSLDYDPTRSSEPFLINASATLDEDKALGGDTVALTVKKDSTFHYTNDAAKEGGGRMTRLGVENLEAEIGLADSTMTVSVTEGHYDDDGFTLIDTDVTLAEPGLDFAWKGYSVHLGAGNMKLSVEKNRLTSFETQGLQGDFFGPSDMAFWCSVENASFEGGELSGTLSLGLNDSFKIGKGKSGLEVSSASLSVTLENNDVTSVGGTLGANVLDDEGQSVLSILLENASIDFKEDDVLVSCEQARAESDSDKTYELLGGRVLVHASKGAAVTASISNNELESFDAKGFGFELNSEKKGKTGNLEGKGGIIPKLSWNRSWEIPFAFDNAVLPTFGIGELFQSLGGLIVSFRDKALKAFTTGWFQLTDWLKTLATITIDTSGGLEDLIPKITISSAAIQATLMDGFELFRLGGGGGDDDGGGKKKKGKDGKPVLFSIPTITIKLYGVPINFGVEVLGEAELSTKAVELSGLATVTEPFELDLENLTLPEFELKGVGIAGGIEGSAGVELAVELSTGDKSLADVGIDSSISANADFEGGIKGTVDGAIDGSDSGAVASLTLDASAKLDLNLAVEAFARLFGDDDFKVTYGLFEGNYDMGPLFALKKTWEMAIGKDLGGGGGGGGAPAAAQAGGGGGGAEPESAVKARQEIAKSFEEQSGGEGKEPAAGGAGGMMQKFEQAKSLMGVLFNGMSIFGSVWAIVADWKTSRDVANYVTQFFHKAERLKDDCEAFYKAVKESDDNGALQMLSDKWEYGPIVVELLKYYLGTVDAAYAALESGAELLGFDSPSKIHAQIEAEHAANQKRAKRTTEIRRKYLDQGYPYTAANNLALVEARAEQYGGEIFYGERLRELQLEYRQKKRRADKIRASEESRLLKAGVDEATAKDIARLRWEAEAGPDYLLDGVTGDDRQKDNRKQHRKNLARDLEQEAMLALKEKQAASRRRPQEPSRDDEHEPPPAAPPRGGARALS